MTTTYKHILAAIDTHKSCHCVIEKAKFLADSLNAKLSFVHVVERDLASEHIFVDQAEYEKTVRSKAEENLSAMSDELNLGDFDHTILIGTPRDEIVAHAKAIHCDLIVLGSHGRHGLTHLLGSTSDSVAHRAPCDTLIVRNGDVKRS